MKKISSECSFLHTRRKKGGQPISLYLPNLIYLLVYPNILKIALPQLSKHLVPKRIYMVEMEKDA
jgi:hypothetical protein